MDSTLTARRLVPPLGVGYSQATNRVYSQGWDAFTVGVMMHSNASLTPVITGGYTPVALALLDVTFDTATTLTGEMFDRLIEHISVTLSRADSALASGAPGPVLTFLSLPRPTTANRRQAQQALRASVMAGRLPGNRTSMTRGARQLDDLARRLNRVIPPHPDAVLATHVVGELARATRIYAQGHTRLQEALARASGPYLAEANAATRLERNLLHILEEQVEALCAAAGVQGNY